jgi:UMF1 family MFS transporter
VPRALAADVRIREAWAWSMYDFANSGYTTVVITAVFGAYFVGVVAVGGRGRHSPGPRRFQFLTR